MHTISSRKQAKALGLSHYFSGKRCVRGHAAVRTVFGHCVECKSLRMKAYYKRHTEKLNARCLAWRINNPEKKYASDMKTVARRYNYPAPSRPRPETCEACGKADVNRRLSLDHCHETGKFRGWLCKECNMGIGKLGDTIEGLEQAIKYLKRAYGVI